MLLRLRLRLIQRRWARYWKDQQDRNLIAFWDDMVEGRI